MNNYHTRHKLNNILDTSEGVSQIFKEYLVEQLILMQRHYCISHHEFLDAKAIISDPNFNNKTMHRLNQRLQTYDKSSNVPML